ncbi:MAG: tetratricopeptide repeat protein [Methanospirillaceae archaeon]|nr:tetratricopeptide repeat protein [Methanospirillaceae archaeon]
MIITSYEQTICVPSFALGVLILANVVCADSNELINQALEMVWNGDYEQALEIYDKAIDAAKTEEVKTVDIYYPLYEAYLRKAQCLYDLERYEEFNAIYDLLLDDCPEEVMSSYSLWTKKGEVLFKLGRLRKQLMHWKIVSRHERVIRI